MLVPNRQLPNEIIEQWPEIFEGVSLTVIPLQYIKSIVINFKDTDSWEIKITEKLKKSGWIGIQDSLSELLSSYDDRIDDLDLKLDAMKIKKDIEKSTAKFLKKNKL